MTGVTEWCPDSDALFLLRCCCCFQSLTPVRRSCVWSLRGAWTRYAPSWNMLPIPRRCRWWCATGLVVPQIWLRSFTSKCVCVCVGGPSTFTNHYRVASDWVCVRELREVARLRSVIILIMRGEMMHILIWYIVRELCIRMYLYIIEMAFNCHTTTSKTTWWWLGPRQMR